MGIICMWLLMTITHLILSEHYYVPSTILSIKKFFFKVYLSLREKRDREREREVGRDREREGDTESEASPRL